MPHSEGITRDERALAHELFNCGALHHCLFLLFRFVCKNNGVLFENDLIQIGVKSEFRQNLGRIGLFYGNKTQYALHSFQPQLSWTEENQAKLAVQVKPIDSVLEAGAQIQQMINAECIDDYNGMLTLLLTFSVYIRVYNHFSLFNHLSHVLSFFFFFIDRCAEYAYLFHI